jgi:hypothetical protein
MMFFPKGILTLVPDLRGWIARLSSAGMRG